MKTIALALAVTLVGEASAAADLPTRGTDWAPSSRSMPPYFAPRNGYDPHNPLDIITSDRTVHIPITEARNLHEAQCMTADDLASRVGSKCELTQEEISAWERKCADGTAAGFLPCPAVMNDEQIGLLEPKHHARSR